LLLYAELHILPSKCEKKTISLHPSSQDDVLTSITHLSYIFSVNIWSLNNVAVSVPEKFLMSQMTRKYNIPPPYLLICMHKICSTYLGVLITIKTNTVQCTQLCLMKQQPLHMTPQSGTLLLTAFPNLSGELNMWSGTLQLKT